MQLEDIAQDLLTLDWRVTNLINLEPGWQANLSNGEHVAIGTGDTMIDALLAAKHNALNGVVVGRLASLDRIRATEEPSSLLAELGLAKPKEIIRRRI